MREPKEWLVLDGETLLHRTVRILSRVVSPVIIASRHAQNLPPLPKECRIVHDEMDDIGPLMGLAVAMRAAAQESIEAVFATGCDHPGLRPEFVLGVIEGLDLDCDAAVVRHLGKIRPLPGVYRVCALPIVEELLFNEKRSLHELLNRIHVRTLTELDFVDCDPLLSSLVNVNTPGDLARWH